MELPQPFLKPTFGEGGGVDISGGLMSTSI